MSSCPTLLRPGPCTCLSGQPERGWGPVHTLLQMPWRPLRSSTPQWGSMAGGPRALVGGARVCWLALPPHSPSPQRRQSRSPRHAFHLHTHTHHSAVPVMSPFAYLVVGVLPNANLGVCSRLRPWQCVRAPCMCSHPPHTHPPHTCNTSSLPDDLGTMPFAATVSCLIPEPGSLSPPSPFNSAPQSVERLGNLEASLLLPLWMFSGRWRRRKHVCELDVPWMFNQERQNCRGAQGWIGRCGLPRPPPSVLQLPAEPRQLLLPAPPPGLGRWPCPACPVCPIGIWG